MSDRAQVTETGPSADSHPRFVKVVRDRIGQFLGRSEVIYAAATDVELVEGLRKKLIEEAAEYVVSPSIGELADIIEVIKALAAYDLGLGATGLVKVLGEASAKRDERGGFDEGTAMFVYSTAPARHEGEHALTPNLGRSVS